MKMKPAFACDAQDEKEQLIDIVRIRLSKGEHIAILFPQQRQAFGYATALKEAGIEVENPKELDFASDKPKRMPYHSAKGLTFDTVVMPRLVEPAFGRMSQNVMKACQIRQNDDQYPARLAQRLGNLAPASISVAGNLEILKYTGIGLISSIQCPGSIIINTFDVIRRLRDERIVMIGGFHSPIERECLDLLLRGSQPVILCPARSLRNLRIGEAARKALAEGRLLVLSFFGDEVSESLHPEPFLEMI